MRRYRGTYTSNRDGKEYHPTVKANMTKLAALGLSITLIAGGSVYAIASGIEHVANNKQARIEAEAKSAKEDQLARIRRIIESHPEVLNDVTYEDYEVKMGDSLGSIAEDCHSTIARLCKLNHINRSDMLYYGTTIKVERFTPKNEIDQEVSITESWFQNYLFGGWKENEEGTKDVYDFLYGPNGIKKKFDSLYEQFHEKTRIDEEKDEYLSSLNSLAAEARMRLDPLGTRWSFSTGEYEDIFKSGGDIDSLEVDHSIYG